MKKLKLSQDKIESNFDYLIYCIYNDLSDDELNVINKVMTATCRAKSWLNETTAAESKEAARTVLESRELNEDLARIESDVSLLKHDNFYKYTELVEHISQSFSEIADKQGTFEAINYSLNEELIKRFSRTKTLVKDIQTVFIVVNAKDFDNPKTKEAYLIFTTENELLSKDYYLNIPSEFRKFLEEAENKEIETTQEGTFYKIPYKIGDYELGF